MSRTFRTALSRRPLAARTRFRGRLDMSSLVLQPMRQSLNRALQPFREPFHIRLLSRCKVGEAYGRTLHRAPFRRSLRTHWTSRATSPASNLDNRRVILSSRPKGVPNQRRWLEAVKLRRDTLGTRADAFFRTLDDIGQHFWLLVYGS